MSLIGTYVTRPNGTSAPVLEGQRRRVVSRYQYPEGYQITHGDDGVRVTTGSVSAEFARRMRQRGLPPMEEVPTALVHAHDIENES